MPFPYVEPDRLELELTYEAHDFGIESDSEWNALLSDALEAASERIDGWTDDGVEWHDADDTVPFVVREAVIRLARLRIASIKEDGLSSETTAAQASMSYRPSQEIRDEVKTALDEAGYRTGDEFWSRTLHS